SLREEVREEPLDAVAEADRAVAGVAPGGPRGRLGGLPRFLQLLAAVLRAFGDRVADALGRLADAFADLAVGDLLGAALDLFGGGLHLRIVGREGESRCEEREREREYHDQSELFHGSSYSDRGAGDGPIDRSLATIDPLSYWTLGSP